MLETPTRSRLLAAITGSRAIPFRLSSGSPGTANPTIEAMNSGMQPECADRDVTVPLWPSLLEVSGNVRVGFLGLTRTLTGLVGSASTSRL